MIKTMPKTLHTNYPLSFFVGFVFSISLFQANAQTELNPNDLPQTSIKVANGNNNNEKYEITKEENEKLRAMEVSGASKEEKEKMLAELGISKSTLQGKPICFTPKTIPTEMLEKFPDLFGKEADAYLANVLILNPAISLDFNMYTESISNQKMQQVSKSISLDEKSILTWVLPNLQLMRKYNNASNLQLVQSMHMFFQHKPEIYNFIPIDMRKTLSSEEGIEQIIQTQQKYLSNL
jgi:hypothetical protein